MWNFVGQSGNPILLCELCAKIPLAGSTLTKLVTLVVKPTGLFDSVGYLSELVSMHNYVSLYVASQHQHLVNSDVACRVLSVPRCVQDDQRYLRDGIVSLCGWLTPRALTFLPLQFATLPAAG